ncbi:hypothetical protein CHLRE_06g299750v5 [Chlamydomonas reinhardtii]|uniref:Yos1-like protein n=1 Tax=Chlamydomonas reinhardtii TaxID=3055 RepID=A8INW7_CHLRE|nr:uncharacterized protein CHLRE_06g299750v5 [Chlamydomonas reinhardtii]PNW82921.1 hypothetical protein CHLRE_06g299750v5 [Chlamydomonas reinhardtii]|eukprot:XP_001691440.1 hypothetical protein CHLREDRAFT_205605 [Chlamydomonas reinhardtii]
MTLWTLLQAGLLVINGVAILNNERFLEKRGFGFSQMRESNSLKMSVIGGIHAVHYFRGVLVPINALVILVKLIFG